MTTTQSLSDVELRRKSNEAQKESISIQKDALANVRAATEKAQNNFRKVFLHMIIVGVIILSIVSYVIYIIVNYLLPYIR